MYPMNHQQVQWGSSRWLEHEESSPRALASTYDRYIAGLSQIGQIPFLYRFNAFPKLISIALENPAYATQFKQAEGRLFVLPT